MNEIGPVDNNVAKVVRVEPTIKLELKVSLSALDIGIDVWVKVAKHVLAALKAPVNTIVIGYNKVHELIEIEAEKSRARIRKTKLIEVAKIYEEGKREVQRPGWPGSEQAKQRLLAALDRSLDEHLERIIQYG